MIIDLDYSVNSKPRYGDGKPPHPKLYEIIDKNRNVYRYHLNSFLKYKDYFNKIPKTTGDMCEPAWTNGFVPGLDAVALYSFLCLNNPRKYIEIGSGNSTKFARRAIKDHGLKTEIVSIDPFPRAEIGLICDKIFRQPVEDIDLDIFDELEAGDILFVDNSHRIFMNSDVTVVFLDILPRLKSGILVEFHDIYLPFDYPSEWINRYYSEQYLLAAYLLAEGETFSIVLPNTFVSTDSELSSILSPMWKYPALKGVETHGGSFWIKKG